MQTDRMTGAEGGAAPRAMGLTALGILIAGLVVWGGLVASTLYLRHRPEREGYPPGDTDDHREDDAPVIRDT